MDIAAGSYFAANNSGDISKYQIRRRIQKASV